MTDEYKKNWLETSKDSGQKYIFPKHFPPLRELFVTEDGMLYVRTYEKGRLPGKAVYDIFNPEGIFIVKKSLLPGKVKNDRLYSEQEKESGFSMLVVYKMIWE